MVTEKIIEAILENYDLGNLISFRIIKKQLSNHKLRLIMHISTTAMSNSILRISSDSNVTQESICGYDMLTRCYTKKGINSPTIYRTNSNQLFTSILLSGRECLVLIEGFINGIEMKEASLINMSQLGKYLGNMHLAALNSSFLVGYNSISGLFLNRSNFPSAPIDFVDINLMNFQYFKHEILQSNINKTIVNSICNLYEEKRERIHIKWESLPRAAVHGDFIANNILLANNKIAGIVDFHLAGDMVLINDLMNSIAYFEYMIEAEHIVENSKSTELANEVLSGYTLTRDFTKDEVATIGDLYAVTTGFLRMRLEKVVQKAASGEIDSANLLLRDMYEKMQIKLRI